MRIALIIGTLLVLSTALAGCSHEVPEQKDSANMGASMQSSGIMSQADYTRIRQVEHDVSSTHTIADADLDFALGLLKGAKTDIARARAMTALSEIHPMSDAQKAKITPAIMPYLESTDKLDQAGAERVQKAMAS